MSLSFYDQLKTSTNITTKGSQYYFKILSLDCRNTFKPKKFPAKVLVQNWLLLIVPAGWWKNLQDFYHIWPLTQWISSIITLILLYWVTGYFYNKWLSDRGGWLNFKMRIWLIISDLLFNLALGLYYMHYRNTLMGGIMLKCPIAISPVIFVLELICVYMYYRFWKTKKTE